MIWDLLAASGKWLWDAFMITAVASFGLMGFVAIWQGGFNEGGSKVTGTIIVLVLCIVCAEWLTYAPLFWQ
ncbi:hypothetical protein N9491_06310 [Planktomarina temperata]|nr:hypothetical protein [Planktomarina temperata]